MLAEYECKCGTLFFHSADHSGAKCPHCGNMDKAGFIVHEREPLPATVERKERADLEGDEWGEYGTDTYNSPNSHKTHVR